MKIAIVGTGYVGLASLVRIIEPGYHGNKRRFSAAGGTDDSHRLSGLYRQINIIQHFFLTFLIIPEGCRLYTSSPL